MQVTRARDRPPSHAPGPGSDPKRPLQGTRGPPSGWMLVQPPGLSCIGFVDAVGLQGPSQEWGGRPGARRRSCLSEGVSDICVFVPHGF